jgi:NAD(P)-dependent dehydrogenase (short-subunit alcohol dehydrogenase family)
MVMATPAPKALRTVVTGANRGIGLEFTRQLLARGDHVEAGAREPGSATVLTQLAAKSGGRLRVHALDVAVDASVHSFAREVGLEPIDLLINNAGVMGQRDAPLAELDTNSVLRAFSVNTVGPLRVTQALLAPLRAGQAKVVNITSTLGSIADNRSGGYTDYRLSKAALNMLTRNLARELASEGIQVFAIHPGWVQTDMGGKNAPLAVDASVHALLDVIDRLRPEESGGFFNQRGEAFPY